MKVGISLLIVLAAAGCHQAVDTHAEEEKLMQTSREWSRVAATDSIDRILSYWADDAVVLSPGDAPIKGKQALREMVEGASKMPGFKISWEPISASVSSSGDMGYLIEQNQMSMTDSLGKTTTEVNKAVTIWKKQPDGSWKNVVDTWNAGPPEKASKP